MNNQLETRIKASLVNGRLPCPAAFVIAKDLNLELKGLFGKPHKA